MNKIKKKNLLSIMLIMCLTVAQFTMVLASGGGGGNGSGGGNGNGSGGGNGDGSGGEDGLQLVSITYNDGTDDLPVTSDEPIPTNVVLTLEFSNNVTDVAVQSTNKDAISVTAEDGQNIDVEVAFPESSDAPYKRQVYVKPLNLEPDSKYNVNIDSSFMAKNGNTLEDTQDFLFLTGESTIENVAESVSETAEDVAENVSETAEDIAENVTETAEDFTPGMVENNNSGLVNMLFVFSVILVIIIVVLFYKKNKK
ncbi:MAG: hypothetical protein ACK5LV_10860 [Lachnospirales bacterium]